MNLLPKVPKKPQGITQEQFELADLLLQLSGLSQSLNKVELAQSGYVFRESQKGSDIRNKNVISAVRGGVHFQVSDWTDEIEASRLGCRTEHVIKVKHLKFMRLNAEQIRSQEGFFRRMCLAAFREAQKRQGG